MRKVLTIIMMVATVATMSAQSKWSYKLGFGGELKSGNVNTTIFNTNGGVERNDSTLAFDANYNYVYGMKDKVEYENNFTGNVKFDLWQYSRWSPFLSATINLNPYNKYNYKLSFLAGAKYRIFWNERCDYSISAAYVLDKVDYFDEVVGMNDVVSRISLRLKIKQKIGENLNLKHTTFYQPSVPDFSGDWIVSSVTSLSTQISKHASIGLNFSYEYHSLVPEGVKNQDIITSATLNLKF